MEYTVLPGMDLPAYFIDRKHITPMSGTEKTVNQGTKDLGGEDTGGALAVALDVGTTTIAGVSIEPDTGTFVMSAAAPNPQSRWGKDLLSRVKAARDQSTLDDMQRVVVDACARIIGELTGSRGVLEITAAGNTVMEHILLGVSPDPLSKVPYRPVFKEARRVQAADAGLPSLRGATLYTFPIIGGFVGGDAVAVALFLGLYKTKNVVLAVDIGTNSEILLSVKGRIYATSAAAGPAFEAGEIENGMTAEAGAIQGLEVEEDRLRLDVVGGVAPRGICGSGLVDAVRAFLASGLLTPSGRLIDASEVETNLSDRISSGENGNRVTLYRGAKGEISLSQADIRALQVAKSAIRAGITILLKKAGLNEADVDKVYIAGAFGSKLSPRGLAAIGLIDEQWMKNLEFVGDAALKGAALALDDEGKAFAEEIARKAKYVSLSGSVHFQGEFLKNMDFSLSSDV